MQILKICALVCLLALTANAAPIRRNDHFHLESWGVYPNQGVFNIGNYGAALLYLTPAQLLAQGQNTLAWSNQQFGLPITKLVHNATDYTYEVFDPVTEEYLGYVEPQMFNSSYIVVSSTRPDIIPVGASAAIVETCFYPSPELVGTAYGGGYAAFVATQPVLNEETGAITYAKAAYGSADNYCTGTYFLYTDHRHQELILTAQSNSARPLITLAGQAIFESEQLFWTNSILGACTNQVNVNNRLLATGELESQIEDHIICPALAAPPRPTSLPGVSV